MTAAVAAVAVVGAVAVFTLLAGVVAAGRRRGRGSRVGRGHGGLRGSRLVVAPCRGGGPRGSAPCACASAALTARAGEGRPGLLSSGAGGRGGRGGRH